MSEENGGEEDKQKDGFSVSEEFDFYFPFTKPLVLDLPTEEDRVLASAWVQKLEAEPETDEDKRERLKYLKLLLFALQRGRLSGIFKKQPPSGPLDRFPQGFSIFDMANWMLEQDDTPACGGGDAGHVPYIIEMSNDLREFIASQEVPNFGVQMYYAWSSDETIDQWSFFDEQKFPQYILDKIKQLQEIKSDEKSTIVKNGCVIKKKGCNLSIPEKYSQKKVKSPQEIERSQGRSFHTYLGLVGRMGNFNDKCNDDPKKFQRQDQRKVKGSKRNDQKKCPGSRGEAEEEEEEFDNPLGGLDAMNRPCLCPFPCHHLACPDYHPKGAPQPNSYENQQTSDRNCGFNMRSDLENPHWTATVTKNPGPRRMREQYLENEMPSQKRSVSPRPRSSSPNHPNLECTPEVSSGGICTCSSPRCPCPCPRMNQKVSLHKIPSGSRIGGRGGVDLNRTYTKSPKEDPCFNENRGIGSYLTSFNAPDTITPSPRRPDITPAGGRTNTNSSLRPVQPDIIHCFDNRNPDPALTKRIDANTDWVQTVGGSNKYMNTDLKIACRRDQLIAAAQQNKCKIASRKGLFSSQQQSSVAPLLVSPCQPTAGTTGSPALETHPLCEYSPPEEASGPCPSSQQRMFSQQNYLECEDSASPQTYCGFHETYGRQITDTYKKPTPQTTSRLKSASTYYLSNPFAVRNDTGRLANMTSVLQGIKQKTEAHRQKCVPIRSPVDNRPEIRVCHSPQPPDASMYSPGPLNKAYADLPMPPEHCPFPSSPYPGYFPDRLVNCEQDEYHFEYEQEDECDSSESLEVCPQEAPNRSLRENIQSCKQQELNVRDDSENISKTLTPGNYGVSFTDDDQCYDPKYINLQRSHRRTAMNVSQRDCGHQRTSPERTIVLESRVSVSPRDFQTMPGDSSNRTSRTQWATSRILPNEVCMNEELPGGYNAYQESDMQNCHVQTPNQSAPGNRYFIESAKSRSGQAYQPMTSTPLQHYKRNFADQGTDDLSGVRPPSGRCA